MELADLFLKVENLKYKKRLEMEKNILKKISQYNLADFAMAVKESIVHTNKIKKNSIFASIFAFILFKLRNKE